MQQAVVEVHIPKAILNYGISKIDVQNHVNEWLVLQLFTEGHVSSGKAARLLNITRIDFLDLLRKRGIGYLDYTLEELEEEFAAVKAFNRSSDKH